MDKNIRMGCEFEKSSGNKFDTRINKVKYMAIRVITLDVLPNRGKSFVRRFRSVYYTLFGQSLQCHGRNRS